MKLLYWDRSLIHIIGSYLEYGENGILNLLSKKYYNKNNKLHINGFILNDYIKEWYCKNFKFNISIIDCKWAVKNGHLNCLKYAHENGCPWDKETCYWAAKYGRLNTLKYAYENGCPYDINDVLDICNDSICKEYIEKKMK